MKRSLYITGGLTLAILMPFGLHAQTQPKDTTMNRTVVVEQEYNPDIMDASKVNVLPKVEEPTITKKEVEYAIGFFPASSIPTDLMRPYTGMEIEPNSKPGYVRAGYGNYGNLDVLANYLFNISNRDKLNLRFQMDGMDGKLTVPTQEEKWKAYYYRTRANMDYTHQFNKVDLNIGANFGLSNFNLAPHEPGKQKFTEGDFHLGVKSTDESSPVLFNAETNFMMYNRQNNNSLFFTETLGETQIHTKGFIGGTISDEQSINIGLDMRNIFYNKDLKLNEIPVYEDRTALNLNPYYKLHNDNWNLHIGANVDLSFGSGKTLRVSPDVVAQFIFSESYVLYAQATGGKLVNDFRRLEVLCPYALPVNAIQDTYEQFNASLGFKASPYPGLWFNLYGGYQDLKDDLFQVSEEVDNNAGPDSAPMPYQFLNLAMTNSHNFYAGMKVSYEYKDIVALSASGIYRNWDAKEDYALLLKPACEFNFNATFKPMKELGIQIGYDYIGREEVKDFEKLSAVSNLYAGAIYNAYKGISIYARINNLLNKKYQYYLGYPTEGFNFVAGVSFSF
ncbi:TonB-dependent receptor [Bacteroides sp.]|uniref:TonB-dependent receptor n=1 Tax=Bacteroides sp. TaxID=29523 RepID=UPI00260CA42E|nr:TonB-dependent receptor [Bacteroides sp.]MDD3036943.1 TonB-dependent receptor [Bacteroides sp.]